MVRMRARELGVPFAEPCGPFNAITDVPGVAVGHSTLILGAPGPCETGEGPVRTGATAIFPAGKTATHGVASNWFSLNGIGELTGAHHIAETGVLNGPIVLTNSLSAGAAHTAVLRWHLMYEKNRTALFAKTAPVVGETWDGRLNDIYGMHLREEHFFAALDSAAPGPVDEGNVGGGTGMICYDFKGGIGTASRLVRLQARDCLVGALVQSNHGSREQLRVAGAPVGAALKHEVPVPHLDSAHGNSIIIVVATDAPVCSLHLAAVCKRAALGLARTGAIAEQTSGDIVIAFSTAVRFEPGQAASPNIACLPFSALDPLFNGTVQAVEEAIINSLVAARTMGGADNLVAHALPHDRLQAVLKEHKLYRPPLRDSYG